MKKRKLVRVFCLGILLVALSGLMQASCTKPGKERWTIKTSVPQGTDFKKSKIVPLSALIDSRQLPPAPGVTCRDQRFDAALIPAFDNSLGLKEGELVTTKGWIHLVALEDDCDYHIQMSDSSDDGNQCFIVEAPSDDPQYESDPALRTLAGATRKWIQDRLLKGHKCGENGNVMDHPPYVEVKGQLFYDDAHVGGSIRGKRGMKAATIWELHPVLEIKFAPKPSH